MKIILQSKSRNKTISDIQAINRNPLILNFSVKGDFETIKNDYDFPQDFHFDDLSKKNILSKIHHIMVSIIYCLLLKIMLPF